MTPRPARVDLAVARRLARALDATLKGRPVDRVWRTDRHGITIRFAGVKPRLVVTTEPGWAHARMTRRWPDTPAAPDQVALRLRACLEGRRVSEVQLVASRWLAFRFDSARGSATLVVQLAGRTPNVSAWQGREPRARDSAAPPAPDVQLHAEAPPFDPQGPPLPDGAGWPFTSQAGAALPSDEAAWLDALDHAAGAEVARRRWRTRVDRARRAASGALKRARRKLRAVEGDLSRAEGTERLRQDGELLKAELHRLPSGRGLEYVDVVDLFDPALAARRLTLDPTLDPVANMARWFARYRKYQRARDAIEARVLEAMEAVEGLVEMREALAALEGQRDHPPEQGDAADRSATDQLRRLERSLQRADPRAWERAATSKSARRAATRRAQHGRQASARLPYRRVLARDGTELLVGRGAADNDRLTFKVARGRDIWMHARDVPGSHVIVRVVGTAGPSAAAMEDAAQLAAWHSRARSEGAVDVQWAPRKQVRKPKGAPPGAVTVSQAKTVAVRVDAMRVTALLTETRAQEASEAESAV